MKTLLLLRHAKSSWDDGALRDFDRPLAPRGRKAAARMGRLLAGRGLLPERILCSTARRARETYDELAPALTRPTDVAFEDRLYLADPGTLLRLVRGLTDEAHSVLLIGHNPGLEHFARQLAGGGDSVALSRLAQKFPTAALAVLSFHGDRWHDLAPGKAKLDDFIPPRAAES